MTSLVAPARRLSVGYARLPDHRSAEAAGIIGPGDGAKARDYW